MRFGEPTNVQGVTEKRLQVNETSEVIRPKFTNTRLL